MQAKFGIERELDNRLRIIDYEGGNGDFHFHSQIEICIVTAGEIDALVNNNRKRLCAGELSVALGYDTHLYTPVGKAQFSVLILPSDICRDFTDFAGNKRIASPFIKTSRPASRICDCFYEIKNNHNNPLIVKGNIYIILGLIAKNVVFAENETGVTDDLISKILLYIHGNYTDNISLSSIARRFGYNGSYISQLFKSCFNIGIARYINTLRLKNAVSLMQQRKYSTTYCAIESGFSSLRTFYRVFSSEFGCSPKVYLKQEKLHG